jgi:hypothetical protein
MIARGVVDLADDKNGKATMSSAIPCCSQRSRVRCRSSEVQAPFAPGSGGYPQMWLTPCRLKYCSIRGVVGPCWVPTCIFTGLPERLWISQELHDTLLQGCLSASPAARPQFPEPDERLRYHDALLLWCWLEPTTQVSRIDRPSWTMVSLPGAAGRPDSVVLWLLKRLIPRLFSRIDRASDWTNAGAMPKATTGRAFRTYLMLGRSLALPISEPSCLTFLTANIIGVASDLTT